MRRRPPLFAAAPSITSGVRPSQMAAPPDVGRSSMAANPWPRVTRGRLAACVGVLVPFMLTLLSGYACFVVWLPSLACVCGIIRVRRGTRAALVRPVAVLALLCRGVGAGLVLLRHVGVFRLRFLHAFVAPVADGGFHALGEQGMAHLCRRMFGVVCLLLSDGIGAGRSGCFGDDALHVSQPILLPRRVGTTDRRGRLRSFSNLETCPLFAKGGARRFRSLPCVECAPVPSTTSLLRSPSAPRRQAVSTRCRAGRVRAAGPVRRPRGQ